MAYTDVDIYPHAGSNIVDAEADGGTRRERAARISAAMRREYPGAQRLSVSYSETFGFQTRTRIRYRVATEA